VPWRDSWDIYLQQGTLARRILRALGDQPERDQVRATYAALCESLQQGKVFIA
jgi:hypothetical protein